MRKIAPLVALKYGIHSALVPLGYHLKPSFIGIGVEKAGTTSLYYYLIAHPDIRHPSNKEVRFFDRFWDNGLRWYWSRFPLPIPGQHFITGEVSPSYLFDPHAVERMVAHVPDVKLIVLLRNPVERAYSHYVHYQNENYDDEPFDRLVEREIERLRREGPDWYLQLETRSTEMRTAYVTRGLYAHVLQRWFNYYPRENMLILKSEDFFAHPAERMADVFRFIGVDPARYPASLGYPNHLPGGYSAEMPASVRDQLHAYYRPYNQELAQLLGWDVSDWDAPQIKLEHSLNGPRERHGPE